MRAGDDNQTRNKKQNKQDKTKTNETAPNTKHTKQTNSKRNKLEECNPRNTVGIAVGLHAGQSYVLEELVQIGGSCKLSI